MCYSRAQSLNLLKLGCIWVLLSDLGLQRTFQAALLFILLRFADFFYAKFLGKEILRLGMHHLIASIMGMGSGDDLPNGLCCFRPTSLPWLVAHPW